MTVLKIINISCDNMRGELHSISLPEGVCMHADNYARRSPAYVTGVGKNETYKKARAFSKSAVYILKCEMSAFVLISVGLLVLPSAGKMCIQVYPWYKLYLSKNRFRVLLLQTHLHSQLDCVYICINC